jgi:hypothetical protein
VDFAFRLNDLVVLKMSGEKGEVRGRAEYAGGGEPHYLVWYVDANGCQCERWISEIALDAQSPA